jgi:hypothetical protein
MHVSNVLETAPGEPHASRPDEVTLME